jgi:hypothetical protein
VEVARPLQEAEEDVDVAAALAGVLQIWGKIIFLEYKILPIEGLEVLEVLTCHKNRMLVVVSETRSMDLVQVEILVAME